jgi:hypothetical protein
MLPSVQRLAELVGSLPDAHIREGRIAVQGLFDCHARLAHLEAAALFPEVA